MDRRTFLVRGSLGVAAVATGAGGAATLQVSRDRQAKEAAERDGRGRGSTRLVYSFDTTEKIAALTFDDGPHPRLTTPLLDVLASHGVLATFFLVGEAAARHPDIVRRQVADGHEIANHTWSHPRLAHLGAMQVREEVARGAKALTQQTGTRPRWFRPPRGVITGPVMHAATKERHDVAMWSAGLNRRLPLTPAAAVTERMMGDLRPGVIFDLHDATGGRDDDPEWEPLRRRQMERIPDFIDVAHADGWQFVTLSELDDRADTTAAPTASEEGQAPTDGPDIDLTSQGG